MTSNCNLDNIFIFAIFLSLILTWELQLHCSVNVIRHCFSAPNISLIKTTFVFASLKSTNSTENIGKETHCLNLLLLQIIGGSRISQRRGCQPQRWRRQPIILVNFSLTWWSSRLNCVSFESRWRTQSNILQHLLLVLFTKMCSCWGLNWEWPASTFSEKCVQFCPK